MKHVTTFSLAAVAAMALMALIGAGSASATALCTTTPTTSAPNIGECPSPWTADTLEMSLTGTAILETLSGTVLDTCTKGTLSATTNGTGSTTETVIGGISSLTWGTETQPCTKTTDTLANGSLQIHAIEDTHSGTLTVSATEVTYNIVFGTCVYQTANNRDLGEIAGGSPATLTIAVILVKNSGNAACPELVRWTANYSVTGPSSLWIATGTE